MRVTINGSGGIVTHGDTLSGGGVIEFPVNEPPEFDDTLAAYTVTGSAPSRKLRYQGHEIAVETPTSTAERAPSTGGDGSAVQTHEDFLLSPTVSIDPEGGARLPWLHLASDHLLDLSTADQPTVIDAGVYAVGVTALVAGTDLNAGGWYRLQLDLDADGADASLNIDCMPTATDLRPNTSLTAVYYIPAGGVIVARIINHDPDAHDFGGSAFIQRLS